MLCWNDLKMVYRDFLRDTSWGHSDYELGYVVSLDRSYPLVITPTGAVRCEYSARLTKQQNNVSVGDWVYILHNTAHDKGQLFEVLPRTSEIFRYHGARLALRQTLAANVTQTAVVMSLEKDSFDLERLVRAVIVGTCPGVRVFIILTKADMVDPAFYKKVCADIQKILGTSYPLFVMSSHVNFDYAALKKSDALPYAQFGLDALHEVLQPREATLLLGASGAGKSTLINCLAGYELQKTGAVRAKDAAGRHTTVSREVVALGNWGLVVDVPGMRSFALKGQHYGVAQVFDDFKSLSNACRFSNCTHTHEPGCALRAHAQDIAHGEERLDLYLRFCAELDELR